MIERPTGSGPLGDDGLALCLVEVLLLPFAGEDQEMGIHPLVIDPGHSEPQRGLVCPGGKRRVLDL